MTETKDLSIEERRERRRQNILNNANDRLNILLSGGPDGEKRQAPALDGLNSIDSNVLNNTNADNAKIPAQSTNLFKR